MSDVTKIKRAILSVTDKTGLVDFARKLAGLGIELISTGGTAKLLQRFRDHGQRYFLELTGFPEMLDGRVKTLHPKVHGGILHRREDPKHAVAAVTHHGISPIDLVVVNLFAFEKTAAKPGVAFVELIENIDIGGPSMFRSDAKNFHDVAIVTSPSDYDSIADELGQSGGSLSLTTKWRLAQKAFATTAAYDSAIASTLERASTPTPSSWRRNQEFSRPFCVSPSRRRSTLRYGENPHQKAAMYSDGSATGVANARQVQGKELSYNNIVDLQAAWDLAQEFNEPVVAIIKHTNPCGTATGKTLAEAFKRALECDPVSAFGGVIGVNSAIDGEAAEEMHKLFLEVIAAPAFDEAAKAKFASKKNLRLVEVVPAPQKWILKNVSGGILVQDTDIRPLQDADLKVVTKRAPTPRRNARPAFRLEGVQAREVQRHCLRARQSNRWRWCGTDEPCRRGQDRRHEGSTAVEGNGSLLRRFLPISRWSRRNRKRAELPRSFNPGVISATLRSSKKLPTGWGLAMLFTGVRHFRH